MLQILSTQSIQDMDSIVTTSVKDSKASEILVMIPDEIDKFFNKTRKDIYFRDKT